MATFTSTRSIFERIEAALEFDLLGSTDKTFSSDKPNDGLSPLNSNPVCNRVERNVIDPVVAGDLYADASETGITVLYGFAQQTPDVPTSGTGSAMTHRLPIEITVLRVVHDIGDILHGAAGYDADDVMDDIQTAFGGARRDGTNFGVRQVNPGPITQLGGGGIDAPWHGRILRMSMRRSHRPLEH